MSVGRTHRMRAWAAAVVCLLGLSATVALGRGTEEHANRLQREGDSAAAAAVYGARVTSRLVDPDGVPPRLAYNYGTALLDLGSPRAEAELAVAAADADSTLRVRALYNLGRWHLLHARDSRSADSVRVHAGLSVSANKDALRIEPGRVDARWNLALAQRMLDSVNAEGGASSSESSDGASNSDERVMSEDLREFENGAEVTDAPRDGSDEALAQGDEAMPLSTLDAEGVLLTDSDRAVIVRKLLTYESRTQRRVRVGRTAPRW
ncbi:MAG: hypothetical protein ABL963_07705 [Longimicrobiales bacterium]